MLIHSTLHEEEQLKTYYLQHLPMTRFMINLSQFSAHIAQIGTPVWFLVCTESTYIERIQPFRLLHSNINLR